MDVRMITSGEMVIGCGEFTYQKVLDDFKNSKFIGIMTYNISTKRSSTKLLNELKDACNSGTEVILITNIPKRFSTYYYANNAFAAKDAIDTYIAKLKPENFGPSMSVYF